MKKVNKKRRQKRSSWLILLHKNSKELLSNFQKELKKQHKKYKKQLLKHKQLVRKKATQLLQYLQYSVSIGAFSLPKKASYHIQVISQKHGIYIFSSLYFLVLFLVVSYLAKKVNLSIHPDDAQEFLIGSAAMIGGSLAIVVSFGLFTVQHAAENLPKDFYKVATDIRKYLIIFLVDSFITITLFIGALSYGKLQAGLSSLSIQLAVTMIGISFYLIFLLLYTIKEDVDPDKILVKVSSGLLTLIETIYNRTKRYAEILKMHPKNRGATSAKSLMAGLYQLPQLKQQFEFVNRHIAYLFDYHDSLSANYQKSAALEVLGHIQALVMKYLNIRKDSSIAYPEENALFVLTSDSKYVLQPILERMNSLSEGYMKAEDTKGIMKTTDVYISWLSSSSEIQYLGVRRQENPIFEQISGYFNQLMKRAINHNSLEGMFQGLRFYKSSAGIAIEKKYIHEFSSTLRIMEEIGYQAIKTRQEPVIQEVFDVYSSILENLVNSKYPGLDAVISMLMEHVNRLTLYGYVLTLRGTLRDNLIAQQDIAKPYNKLHDLIVISVNKAAQATTDEIKRKWQHITLELVKELRRSFRHLAEEFKNPNHFIVLSFGQIIGVIGTLLIKLSKNNAWSEHHNELISESKRYIHLPTWFIHDVKKIKDNQSFEALIEAVASIGLIALEEGKDDIASEAIKILSKMATDMLDREKTDGAMYIEPSIMKRACYIGILALKKQKTNLVNALKQSIEEFDTKYKAVYFSDVPEGIDPYSISPPPDKLKRDIASLVNDRQSWDFDRIRLGDSRDKAFELITSEDINNFINTIWQ